MLIIIGLLLAACAPTTKMGVVPDDVRDRMVPLFAKIQSCSQTDTGLYLHQADNVIAAWTDKTEVHITSGILRYDDDTLSLIFAHELAHVKLEHVSRREATSNAVTAALLALDAIIPGAGVLNLIANPAAVNNYSKGQEFEADTKAVDVCVSCLKMSKEQVLKIFTATVSGEGGFWSTHPSAADRIANVENYLRISPRSLSQTAPAVSPLPGKGPETPAR